jgi:hypothetical protein
VSGGLQRVRAEAAAAPLAEDDARMVEDGLLLEEAAVDIAQEVDQRTCEITKI